MKSNFYWVYGRHTVEAVLKNYDREISRIVLGAPDGKIEQLAGRRKISVELVGVDFFNSVFGKNVVHQKYAAYIAKLPQVHLEDIIGGGDEDLRPIIILDQVTDPQNIGSVLRCSAVFNARAVIVQDKHSPELNATSLKASSGASELIPLIRVTNIANTIQSLQKHGFWIVGLDEDGDRLLSDLPKSTKYAVVVGSEGKGMRKLTKDFCDFVVKIPSSDKFSTLNAAQAATVSLYELFRRG